VQSLRLPHRHAFGGTRARLLLSITVPRAARGCSRVGHISAVQPSWRRIQVVHRCRWIEMHTCIPNYCISCRFCRHAGVEEFGNCGEREVHWYSRVAPSLDVKRVERDVRFPTSSFAPTHYVNFPNRARAYLILSPILFRSPLISSGFPVLLFARMLLAFR
jgi:hypothetical protein